MKDAIFDDWSYFDIFWLFWFFSLPRGGRDSKMKPLPDSAKKLIEARTFANIATLMPDGSPQVTQTWVDHDGDIVLINTFEGSQKHRNVTRDPRVALTIIDPKNEYNIAVIRGRVKEVTLDGADGHIDKMAKKYLGQDTYPMRQPGMKRVLIKIEPTRIVAPWSDDARRQAWQNRQEK